MWTKSCGITIQMKPLKWYLYVVLLFFSIPQSEIQIFFFFLGGGGAFGQKYVDKIKSCSVIIEMKPLGQYFHVVLFIFQHFTK